MTNHNDLTIIDVSDPARPIKLGSLRTPGDARKLFVYGQTAYVADGNRGLAVIDVSQPTAPRLVGSIPTPGFAEEVVVSDGIAYLAAGTDGLAVLAPVVTTLTSTGKGAPPPISYRQETAQPAASLSDGKIKSESPFPLADLPRAGLDRGAPGDDHKATADPPGGRPDNG